MEPTTPTSSTRTSFLLFLLLFYAVPGLFTLVRILVEAPRVGRSRRWALLLPFLGVAGMGTWLMMRGVERSYRMEISRRTRAVFLVLIPLALAWAPSLLWGRTSSYRRVTGRLVMLLAAIGLISVAVDRAMSARGHRSRP